MNTSQQTTKKGPMDDPSKHSDVSDQDPKNPNYQKNPPHIPNPSESVGNVEDVTGAGPIKKTS